jgi:3-hydroxy-9,10-secoandrosta-1,3,5(10)-triene-9,17-dione monooxygenase
MDDLLRLRAHVRGLLPRIAERAAAAEAEGLLPEQTLIDLERQQLHRFLEPRDFGGFGLPFGAFFSLITELATSCGSTAWTVMLFAVHGWGVQFMPERIRKQFYQHGRPGRVAGVFMNGGTVVRRAGNEYVVNGCWNYVTGLHLADWLAIKATDETGEEVDVFLPPAAVTVRKDWHAPGLRATASHSVVLDNKLVPADWVVDRQERDAAFQRRLQLIGGHVPPVPAVVTLGTLAPVLGMTRAVLNIYEERQIRLAAEKRAQPGAMERVARMRSQLKALELLYRQAIEVLDTRLQGRTLSDHAISGLQMDAAWIGRSCREMAAELLSASGTRLIAEGGVLVRHATAIATLTSHYLIDYDGISLSHGALLLGVRKSP